MVYKNPSGTEVDSLQELNLEKISGRITSKIKKRGPGISYHFKWPQDNIMIISSNTLEQLKESGNCELFKELGKQEKPLLYYKATLDDGTEVFLTVDGKLNSNELILRGGSSILTSSEET